MNVETAMPQLETRIRLFNQTQGKRELLGFADLTIGGAFVIKDITIVRSLSEESSGEAFVSYPSKKGSGNWEGKYFDVAHPVTAEAHKAASDAILRAFNEALAAQPQTGGHE